MAAYLRRLAKELCDLTRAPDELRNVADDPAYADGRKGLRRWLEGWREQTRDPWLVKNQHE